MVKLTLEVKVTLWKPERQPIEGTAARIERHGNHLLDNPYPPCQNGKAAHATRKLLALLQAGYAAFGPNYTK